MKKILFIHHSGSVGGAGINVYHIAKILKKKYEVKIYCPSNPSDLAELLRRKNLNIEEYEFNPGYISYYSGSGSVFSLSFIKGIISIFNSKSKWQDILKKEKPDMVLVNSKILSWFSLLLSKEKIKGICYVGETKPSSIFGMVNRIQKALLEKFSGVIFISKFDEYAEGLTSTKTKVVPNFIQLETFKKTRTRKEITEDLDLPNSGFNILFVGGMHRIKGYKLAVRSLKYLKNYKVNLIVAGYSDYTYRPNTHYINKIYNFIKKKYEDNLNKFIVRNNLDASIFKIGLQENMEEIYKISDVLVFPATVPHQARPVFEAGAQSVPVIVPNFPHYDEYVQENVNGLFFKRNNPKSLAKCIERVLNDEKFREKMGILNYKSTVENHSHVLSGELLLKIIEEVI